MQKIIHFLFKPNIISDDISTTWQLNIFYRILSFSILFIAVPYMLLYAKFQWWSLIYTHLVLICGFSFSMWLAKKKHLRSSVNLYIIFCLAPILHFLLGHNLSDGASVIPFLALVSAIFLSILNTAIWCLILSFGLGILAWLSPHYTFAPTAVMTESGIKFLIEGNHLSTMVSTIWVSAVFGGLFSHLYRGIFAKMKQNTDALEKENSERLKAEKEIQSLNENLEIKISERTKELIKKEEQLRHSEKMRAIGQLAGGVAHDFNNQLTGIMSCAEIISRRAKEDDELHTAADTILMAAKRTTDLTKQLTAFARKGGLEKKAVDLHRVINNVITLLEHSIDKKISIVKKLESKCFYAIGDASMFENAILNCALNSRDAMPDGGTLTFSTADYVVKSRENGSNGAGASSVECVKITVADTGYGIEEAVLPKVFEPYFTTKETGSGSGMGLAAVYGIVHEAEGSVTITSNVGKGTCVTINLKSCAEPEDTRQIDVTESADDLSCGIILVVDDEQIVRTSTLLMLKALGYTAQACESGFEAIGLYKDDPEKFSCIILDYMMPGMDGQETLRKLRQVNPEVNIIISTGWTAGVNLDASSDESQYTFIRKPFQLVELRKALNEVLQVYLK